MYNVNGIICCGIWLKCLPDKVKNYLKGEPRLRSSTDGVPRWSLGNVSGGGGYLD